MHASRDNIVLSDYKSNFERLQAIAYKDLFINGVCIRCLGIHFMDFVPDWFTNKHKHSFFEFHYITENYGYTVLNGVENRISAGQFYIMPPGTYHSHRQDPGTGHIGFALRWEVVTEEKRNYLSSNMTMDLDKINELLQHAPMNPMNDTGGFVIDKMIALLNKTEHCSRILELQLAFTDLLITISSRYTQKRGDISKEVNSDFLENRIVNSAIKFIEENYTQEIDVHDVSNSVHLSYSHLSRLFKKYGSGTITYYLNRVRLARSQVLLQCSDKSIGQIAREVGFGSEHYYCSVFKKLYGISPGNYRGSKNQLFE